jgi:hypothetical protein
MPGPRAKQDIMLLFPVIMPGNNALKSCHFPLLHTGPNSFLRFYLVESDYKNNYLLIYGCQKEKREEQKHKDIAADIILYLQFHQTKN